MADAEGQLPPGGPQEIVEVDEDALRRLGTEVNLCGGVLRDALMGLKHQVEFPNVGEIRLAAAGAGDFLLPDVGYQAVLVHGLHLDALDAVGGIIVLNELIGPVAHFTGLAVDERIVEGGHVARRHPDLRIHENGRVLPHIIGTLLDELFPPGLFYIVFQFHTQGAVIPGVGQSAVDF